MVVYVKVFTDGDDLVPRQVVPFTDPAKAATFAADIFPNDALFGITRIELETATSDDEAVDSWWASLNDEV